MRALALVFTLILVLSTNAFAQLSIRRGTFLSLGIFPSSGTSCTLQDSLSDGTKKNKSYWWSCTVNSSTNARLAMVGYVYPGGFGLYGLSSLLVKIASSQGSNKRLCAVFSPLQYFSRGALQVNQTGSDWRKTAWYGGSAGSSNELVINSGTTPWVYWTPPTIGSYNIALVDVMNNTPSPSGSLGEIVVREVIIGECGQFCGGTNPPSCCPSNCTDDYVGDIHVYGASFY